jgi:hypothetical protein
MENYYCFYRITVVNAVDSDLDLIAWVKWGIKD